MHLTIKNLGRLESASIDLEKPLTVFVGRNNTSKTYVAYTVYALHRYIWSLVRQLVEAILRGDEAPGGTKWEIDVVSWLKRHVESILRQLGALMCSRLPDVLAAPEDFVTTTSTIIERGTDTDERLFQAFEALEMRRSLDGRVQVDKPANSHVATFETSSEPRFARGNLSVGVVYLLTNMICSLVLPRMRPEFSLCFALSTERTAIQLFYRELLANRSAVVDVVRQMSPEDAVAEIQRETRFYPLAIRDGLAAANNAATNKNIRSPLASIADKLEATMGGAIAVDELGDLVFKPAGRAAPLGLQLASSSVKSLAALSFYLRHIARPGGFLLIDEPELSLHPDNQRKVARILAEIVNAGVRVLITTHSDYILRELSNLVLLNRPEAAELRETHGYATSELLSPESIGVYLFDETTAHPLDIADNGIEVQTIDDEINRLNQISRDIFFKLSHKPQQS